MNEIKKYTIPAGTLINTRNLTQDLRLKKHITRKDLIFEELANTGDGGLLYYFVFKDWLIAVNANDVIRVSDATEFNSIDLSLPLNMPDHLDVAC